jgi:hypothetical protein
LKQKLKDWFQFAIMVRGIGGWEQAMATSDFTQCAALPPVSGERGARLNQLRGRLGRVAAAASVAWLSLTVTVMAQTQNIYEKPSSGRFKAAPKAPDAEAEAEASVLATDFILGIHVNTIFFIVAAAICVLWFTVGGGRKPKVTQHR